MPSPLDDMRHVVDRLRLPAARPVKMETGPLSGSLTWSVPCNHPHRISCPCRMNLIPSGLAGGMQPRIVLNPAGKQMFSDGSSRYQINQINLLLHPVHESQTSQVGKHGHGSHRISSCKSCP